MKAKSLDDMANMCKLLALRGLDFSCDASRLVIKVRTPLSVIVPDKGD